ncbi:helix-turn-helix domain-containing protein [Pseudoduganella namucuonensis]|uniref:Cytoskeleton protein RodZ n=1 Tax=Pseudoduganella namucuonensis TaxID=1035707 RepID=A0A1I7LBM1_9BURK|nr:RodZ domain-containing protein [Pseudoduganella namucuonensis]SFV07048.1 cytoskeleton protein RodZ [Pseudoduganella namucuonensis]
MNSEWAQQPEKQSGPGAPGAQLAAQREAMGLTVDQIADQLKLAPRQVAALEAGDYASLPNMAVTRGFVRAYAKVVKLDAAPLVAMIEVNPIAGHEHPPARRERISATFSESRFPQLTERSSKPTGWIMGAAVAAVVAAAFAAWHLDLFPNIKPGQATAPAAPAVATVPVDPAAAGAASAPLQSPNVPLISVPPPADASGAPAGAGTPVAGVGAPAAGAAPGTVPAAPANAVPAAPAVAAPAQAAPAAAQPAPAAAATLVLKVSEDSWVEIKRPGKPALISRLVKAGSTETFEITDPALLVVGKPTGVQATLRGAPLPLPPVAGGTISRVNIQ